MNKQQLAQKIWASANQMRSKIEANEYKDYILGFIFYKYLSDKEVKFLKENDYDDELLKTVSEEDDETVKWVQENIGYFISYKDLFSTWLSMGQDFDVSNVRDALSAFSRLISNTHKKVFEKVFDEDIDAVAYIEEHGLKIVEDTGLLTSTISRILDENPGPLSELLGGKEKVMGFFVGQIMKEMKGKANPASVREALLAEVEKRK